MKIWPINSQKLKRTGTVHNLNGKKGGSYVKSYNRKIYGTWDGLHRL